jgi:hypothetical protein
MIKLNTNQHTQRGGISDMDFETLLKNRRSIRDFQNKEVPLPVIREIIQDPKPGMHQENIR